MTRTITWGGVSEYAPCMIFILMCVFGLSQTVGTGLPLRLLAPIKRYRIRVTWCMCSGEWFVRPTNVRAQSQLRILGIYSVHIYIYIYIYTHIAIIFIYCDKYIFIYVCIYVYYVYISNIAIIYIYRDSIYRDNIH